jgi:uncharacterized protein YqeY
MSLKETLDNRIKDAMRSKDQAALRALRAVKSAIMLVETSEGRTPGPLSADEEMAVLLKQAKQRKDSIEQFVKAGREDLAVGEREELVIIEEFLPKALTAEELEAEVKALIAEVGATSAKDLGKVMGVASKRLAGRADGKLVSETVKKLLA